MYMITCMIIDDELLSRDMLRKYIGQGDYIRILLEGRNFVVHDTIKNFLTSLPEEEFMRMLTRVREGSSISRMR